MYLAVTDRVQTTPAFVSPDSPIAPSRIQKGPDSPRVTGVFTEALEQESKLPPPPPLFIPKRKKDFSKLPIAFESMSRNLKKATKEHRFHAAPSDKRALITLEQLSQITFTPQPTLDFTAHRQSEIGQFRKTNQDVELLTSILIKGQCVGTLTAVLDGHCPGGRQVADFVANHLPTRFTQELELAGSNVLFAMARAVDDTQAALHEQMGDCDGGCVAVFCYIEKQTGLIYTLTVGDCEAFDCRMIDGIMVLIPLSNQRDWGCDSDAERAASGDTLLCDEARAPLSAAEIKAKIKTRLLDPKNIRLRSKPHLNVSRGFGDFASAYKGKGVICRFKATVFQLEDADSVLLMCDGVINFLPLHMIRAIVQKYTSIQTVVAEIIRQAQLLMILRDRENQRKQGDNVSVVGIKIFKSTTSHQSV